ncbi:MAG: hypothetical protein U1E81_22060 [Xanthobacteraceae bacterium]
MAITISACANRMALQFDYYSTTKKSASPTLPNRRRARSDAPSAPPRAKRSAAVARCRICLSANTHKTDAIKKCR